MNATRKRVSQRRHLDLVPRITGEALAIYTALRRYALAKQRYMTGARYGQELAASRKGP